MFGIGGFELFLILLFGFLIFGPDRLPGIARTIGNAISRFRNASDGMNKTLQNAQKEIFNKDSAEPFKNPLDVIDNITGTTAAATGAAQAHQSSGTTKTITSSSTSSSAGAAGASSRESTEHAESFAERKARYDRERSERKAAEKKAAEQAAAEASAATHAYPVDKVANKTLDEAVDSNTEASKSADAGKAGAAAAEPISVATAKTDATADLEKKEA